MHTLKEVTKKSRVLLNKIVQMTLQHSAHQEKTRVDAKLKCTSLKHVCRGGPGDIVASLREQMAERDGELAVAKKMKAEKALCLAISS